jgi:hypothetical protein
MFPYMLNYQLYLDQMKGNPYAAIQLQRMMGIFPQQQQAGGQGGYIPFSKLPFTKHVQMQEKKDDGQVMKN